MRNGIILALGVFVLSMNWVMQSEWLFHRYAEITVHICRWKSFEKVLVWREGPFTIRYECSGPLPMPIPPAGGIP